MQSYFLKIFQDITKESTISYDDIYLVTYTHILDNSVTFFQSLPLIGIKKENLFILGKSYSTIPDAQKTLQVSGLNVQTIGYPKKWGGIDEETQREVKQLCQEIKEKIGSKKAEIITLESGGVLRNAFYQSFANMPNVTLAGAELTTQGDYFPFLYPTIDVALSSAKKELEKFCVAENIIDNLNLKKLIRSDWTYGIIGYGAIGGEVAKDLQKNNAKILVFDIDKSIVPIELYADLPSLISHADCIIGTTGKTSLDKKLIDYMKDDLTLVSTSSRDTEFLQFLLDIKIPFKEENTFSDLEINLENGKKVYLINGGFPINYNRIFAADEAEMMMTYGLWLASFLQIIAFNKLSKKPQENKVPLQKDYQRIVVKNWLNYYKDFLLPERIKIGEHFLREYLE